MRGVDTNVLVRYLVKDDPDQYRVAAEFFDRMRASREPVRVDPIVLCELVWVLRASYGYARDALAMVIEKVLSTEQFEVEEADTAWLALADFMGGRADFADCLIGRRNADAGASGTVTFDGRVKGLAGFELLPRATRPSGA